MRHKHQSLVNLGFPLAVDIADHNGQRHRQHDIQHDKRGVVQQRVAQDLREVPQLQEVLKILESDPLAVEQIVEKVFRGVNDFEVLHCKDNAEHRQIAEQDVPYRRRDGKNCQLCIVLRPLPKLLFLNTGVAGLQFGHIFTLLPCCFRSHSVYAHIIADTTPKFIV